MPPTVTPTPPGSPDFPARLPDPPPYPPPEAGPVLFREEGPESGEVARLRARGLLRAVVGDVHTGTGEPETRELRVSALARILPPARSPADAVVGYRAARWALVGGPVPPRIDVYALPGLSRRRFRGLRVREARLVPGTVMVLAGLVPADTVAVTVPDRTAADLARSLPAEEALAELRLLAEVGVTPARVAAVLESLPGHRGVPRARQVLNRWASGVRPRSFGTASGDPVGVENSFDAADGGEHVVEMTGVGHLEGEPRDGHPVA
jgi:hypothetical protein